MTQPDDPGSEIARTPRTEARAPMFTPAFIALAVADLAYFTAVGLTIPVTPLFAEGRLGASPAGVGLAIGAFSATALVLRPFAGQMADRRGRRPLLVGGALLVAVATALHLVASNLVVLVVLRLLLGVGEAFFFVASFAALADLAPPGRLGEALSFNSLSLYLGIAIGPFIGEVLLTKGGFGLAWTGGAALALVAAVLATRIPETWTRSATPGPVRFVHRPAVWPSVALFSGIAAMSGFLGFAALHARDLGMDGSRGVLLAFGLVVVGCRIVFARLPDRVSPYRLGAGALALIAVGLGIVAAVQTPSGLLIGAVVMAAGVAFTTPAFFGAIFSRVTPAERGAASGTASAFLDLAFGGGPLLVGVVASRSGIPAGFATAALVAVVGAGGTALAGRRHRTQDVSAER